MNDQPQIYFSDFFDVPVKTLEKYGAFNVSLINDLPLFVDPFLLFHSDNAEYQALHEGVIEYVAFLRDKAVAGSISDGDSKAWFHFKEIRQNWLGYSLSGNGGSGLGKKFANTLTANLRSIFKDFGKEKIPSGSHLERLCLIEDGVGRDNISDFATNLIKSYLLEYTQAFARKYLKPEQRKVFSVKRVRFNYDTETWATAKFELPAFEGDFILLTPTDLLTQENVWINRDDLYNGYTEISESIDNAQLRSQIDNYFIKRLGQIYERDQEAKKKEQSEATLKRGKSRLRRRIAKERESAEPTKKQRIEAMLELLREFPELLDYYVRFKEETGDKAEAVADARVKSAQVQYQDQIRELATLLQQRGFYRSPANTLEEAKVRIDYLKDIVEEKGGYRLFFKDGKPIGRESDLQIMYRLTWLGTPSDVTREANDGRGPVDFKVSRGAHDKTLVEFKLARSSSLKRNLEAQTEAYQTASDASGMWKVIICFTDAEVSKLQAIVNEFGKERSASIVMIDARADNKPSGSKAKKKK